MTKFIHESLTEIVSLCKEHKVKSLYLFGSAAKGDMQSHSDIDFLVQFSEDIQILDYADNYFSLLENLEKLLNKKIDLVSIKSLKNPILIKEIEGSKLELYAA